MRRHTHHKNNTKQSRCGDLIVRGSFQKIIEKYEELSRTAATIIEAENFKQHAEHYRRVINGAV